MSILGNADRLRQEHAACISDRTPPERGQWVEGRIVDVLASPSADNATHLAVGMSSLPAGFVTPTHSHAAEEIAVVLSGYGAIVIGAERVVVIAGDVVRTPPDAPHHTESLGADPLHVLWVYAPAGSETRWLPEADVVDESRG